MNLNQIIEGDCLTALKTMPDNLVQCVVTSPPYWGLRDYGEPGQLGLEASPEEYVAKMVEIFAEVRRVLRDDGTLWLNLGDSYAGSWGNSGSREGGQRSQNVDKLDRKAWDGHTERPPASFIKSKRIPRGKGRWGGGNMPATDYLKPKDLCGMPWRVAFALQADGWYLRSDIIWSKPNPMPESVTDRPTKAHEYMFLLTKKAKYYYDADAIREANHPDGRKDTIFKGADSYKNVRKDLTDPHERWPNPSGRNRRTVWEIATHPYSEAHFATFPEKLVEPCILAGSNDRACGVCGAAWERVTEKGELYKSPQGSGNIRPIQSGKQLIGGDDKASAITAGTDFIPGCCRQVWTRGFRPTCEHDNGDSRSIILDPFMGSGTVALVALKHGRDYIGIELKQDYIDMAMKRLKPLGNRPLPQQETLL